MKGILSILLVLLWLFPANTSAAQIQVGAVQIPNWQFSGATAKLRVIPNDSFFNTEGVQILRGSVAASSFYKDVTCTVSNGAVSCPSFTIDSTTDSSAPSVTYSAYLFDAKNVKRSDYLLNFKVPTSLGSSVTWAQLSAYNKAAPRPPNPTYPTTDIVSLLIQQQISNIVLGTPVETSLLKYSSISDALSQLAAGGSLQTTLVVSQPTTVSQSALIPANINLRFTNTGYFSVAAGATLTVQGTIDAPATSYIFQGAGAYDFTQAKVKSYYPDWFGTGAAAITRAADAAYRAGGGNVEFVSGKSYTISSTVELTGKYNIKFLGHASGFSGETKPSIIYTGAGANPAISVRSTEGITFENVYIQYTNPAFTGGLIVGGHYNVNAPADTQRLNIKSCIFTGTLAAQNSTGMVVLDRSIVGTVKDSHFYYAQGGIRGSSDAGGYSFSNTISGNMFNQVTIAIINPYNWTITDNTFEPNSANAVRAVDTESTDAAYFSRSNIISHNYIGDAGAQSISPIRIVRQLGGTIENNFIDITGTARPVEIIQSTGITITGNRTENATGFVNFTGGQSRNITIASNAVSSAAAWEGVEPINLTVTASEGAPNTTGGGFTVGGFARPTNSFSNIDFGFAQSLPANGSAKMFILDLATGTGLRNRALGIFAPVIDDAQIGFFTSDTLRAHVSGSGFFSNVPFTAFNGATIGANGTLINKILRGTVTINPASIAASSAVDQTFTLTGAAAGDTLTLNPPALSTGLIVAQARVSAANTAAIRFFNPTGAAIDEPSGVWTYMLVR